jgi:L-arabinose isomerase
VQLKKQKPKIGFLGIMHGLYDDSQPEIPENQKKFVLQVIEQLKDVADLEFPGIAKDRQMIEKYVAYFNQENFDGIMIVNLLYSPGMRVVQALKANRLPLLLSNIQPLPSVTNDWNWSLLTTNQGIHGMQDTGNMVMRTGISAEVITEDWQSETFKSFFADWAYAANTAAMLKRLKIAIFGRMHSMGDILGDDAAFYRIFGLEVNQESIGQVYKYQQSLKDKEIDRQVEADRSNFLVDKNITEESHRYAASLQLAFEKFLDDNGYCGFSPHFNVFKEDGRFRQLPILGASNMLAKGYGYSAEGDTHALTLTVIGHLLIGDPHFTEMYSLDFKRDAAMMSHMGEGNWKIARKDRPIRLIDRPLDIGDLENPPTPVYSAQPGIAILASLVAVEGGFYRLVTASGIVLDTPEILGIPMNYSFFKPDSGIRHCMDEWLKNGGTHHQVMFSGHHLRKLRMLCDMLDIEFAEV